MILSLQHSLYSGLWFFTKPLWSDTWWSWPFCGEGSSFKVPSGSTVVVRAPYISPPGHLETMFELKWRKKSLFCLKLLPRNQIRKRSDIFIPQNTNEWITAIIFYTIAFYILNFQTLVYYKGTPCVHMFALLSNPNFKLMLFWKEMRISIKPPGGYEAVYIFRDKIFPDLLQFTFRLNLM